MCSRGVTHPVGPGVCSRELTHSIGPGGQGGGLGPGIQCQAAQSLYCPHFCYVRWFPPCPAPNTCAEDAVVKQFA